MRRLERERKRRREQQEEAALQDFLSGCPSTGGEAEYPFATAPSQVLQGSGSASGSASSGVQHAGVRGPTNDVDMTTRVGLP